MARLSWLRVAAGRLRQRWWPVVEATVAATVAWILAARLVGHPQPFFAPAAALIVLGQATGPLSATGSPWHSNLASICFRRSAPSTGPQNNST